MYDKESLLAGKIHAILCIIYSFLANDTKVNMDLIKSKLIESDYLKPNSIFNINILKELLINKFNEINYNEAKEDVISFIKNVDSLNIWNKDFFIT